MPSPSGRTLSIRRAVAACLAVVLGAAARAGSATSPPRDPWQAALNLDFNTAARALEHQHAANPDDPRLACAFAASLLVRDPVTAANVSAARRLLEAVASRLPVTESRCRPLALYLLARIAHEHADPPRLDEARTHYEQLRREYPGHPLADQAAVHLALLRTGSAAPAEAVAIAQGYLATVQSPPARRELHHLLAWLEWRRRGDAAAALPHYLSARAIGFETPYRNGEVDLTIAGLATAVGRDEIAAEHYRAFADANPSDGRAQTARRLAREALARTGKSP